MFKSCDYCRHRKKRCIRQHESTRCADCEHLDLSCEFSYRQPSLKRRLTSRQNAERLRHSQPSPARPRSNDGEAENDAACGCSQGRTGETGDCQLRIAGHGDMLKKHLLQPKRAPNDGEWNAMITRDVYWQDVHPFFPYIPVEMLEQEILTNYPLLQCCIESFHHLSPNIMDGTNTDCVKRVNEMADRNSLSLPDAAGLLIVTPCLSLDDQLVKRIFAKIESANVESQLPLPILAGAISTHAWRRLAGSSLPPLCLQSHGLQSYVESLDSSTFAHHYLRLSQLAVDLNRCRAALELNGVTPEAQVAWAQLEYDFFLWQVCLPSTLLDTRDEIPATPQSVVIHCLSSLLLLSFYSDVLQKADTLGKLLALQPVPGVLLFICALARSTFICPRELLDRWSLLAHIQAKTARMVLSLWHQTGYENFKAILNLWEDVYNWFPDLAKQIREQIGTGPWTVEEIDGYSVFWTFRDLRSLTSKFIATGRQ